MSTVGIHHPTKEIAIGLHCLQRMHATWKSYQISKDPSCSAHAKLHAHLEWIWQLLCTHTCDLELT